MDRERAQRVVEQFNQRGRSYHCWDFGDGLAIRGDYDMTRYLPFYQLPERLDGLTVLDVGTAAGFFALQCARRGARVTAIDLWEPPGQLHAVAEVLGLEITYHKKDIYTLDASFGQFDLVICGSLLMHLPDLVGAIRRLRSVCRGRAVISTASTPDSAANPRPICDFVGARATDGDYWHYWDTSAAAFRKILLAAGFSAVDWTDHFLLSTEPGRAADYHTPHVVAGARV